MTEQQPYDVVRAYDGFELRRYPAHLVAEVEVTGSFATAGNRAFGLLADFIGGRNTEATEVAMTAPVVQEEATRTPRMTALMVQESRSEAGRHVVGFVMPAGFTLDTLPTPTDPRVRVRVVEEHLAAARRFSGRWTAGRHGAEVAALRASMVRAGLTPSGPVRFARFDPPWTPWPLRRNEVVVPVVEQITGTTGRT